MTYFSSVQFVRLVHSRRCDWTGISVQISSVLSLCTRLDVKVWSTHRGNHVEDHEIDASPAWHNVCVSFLHMSLPHTNNIHAISKQVSEWIFTVHNVSRWPNLRHLGESLGGACWKHHHHHHNHDAKTAEVRCDDSPWWPWSCAFFHSRLILSGDPLPICMIQELRGRPGALRQTSFNNRLNEL